jgi:hypothetical protein
VTFHLHVFTRHPNMSVRVPAPTPSEQVAIFLRQYSPEQLAQMLVEYRSRYHQEKEEKEVAIGNWELLKRSYNALVKQSEGEAEAEKTATWILEDSDRSEEEEEDSSDKRFICDESE